MNNIPEILVKERLHSWTLSAKVQETLGLSSMDEGSFKKELTALESKGIIERSGARRGLRFKYKDTEAKTESKEATTGPVIEEKATKVKSKPKVDIAEIPCEITCLDRHEFTKDVTNVSIGQLLAFIAKNPGEHSFSLAIKRTQRGIQVKTYKDIFLLSDVLYTKESFMLLLKASGITFE